MDHAAEVNDQLAECRESMLITPDAERDLEETIDPIARPTTGNASPLKAESVLARWV